ncbi:MAG: hypothetical protein D4R65_06725 [Verrucomicrobiaceae bacterium]|nr:MAG: hypothetical protein D4R65_06725 [Verrucomicrobiaceae bacterium]
MTVNGGTVTNVAGFIGRFTNSQGTATVSSGTWASSGTLYVGFSGNGILNLTNSGVVSATFGANPVTIGNFLGSVGTLNLGTGTTAGTLNATTVNGGAGTATVNFNQSGSYTFAPNLTGTLAVNAIGSGNTTLAGTNTYSGNTTITAGKLAINGNNSGATGAVLVQDGGTIGGNGTIGGAITVQFGGTLAPGNSIATLTGTTATFETGSLFALEGNGAFFDRLTLSGAATIQFGAQISFNLLGALTQNSYTLLSAASGLDGTTKFTLSGAVPTGYALNYSGTALTLDVLPLANAYWKGETDALWTTNDSGTTNWATAQDGLTNTTRLPGASTDVTFSANGSTNQNTTLGADFSIKSLTVNDPAAVTIGGSNTLTISGNNTLTVGAGAGLLTISVNSLVLDGATSQFAIGNSAGALISSGISGSSTIVKSGNGTLTLSGNNTYSGDTTIKSGTLALASGGSNFLSANTTVGDAAGDNGVLLISGGVLRNNAGVIGNSVGSNGSATITSGNWTNTSLLTVGNSGNGSLLVNGGSVSTNGSAFIGKSSGSSGSVTVTSGTLTSSLALYLGKDSGSSGSLLVNGGLVSSLANAYLGFDVNSTGAATVTSGTWAISKGLSVGQSGNGTLLINGGNVSLSGILSPSANIGAAAGSTGMVTVTSGTLEIANSLATGVLGNGTLLITGGNVSNKNGSVGFGSNSTGNVTVSGGNWTNNGTLTVADSGTGKLVISGNGSVSDTTGTIANSAGSTGSVTVTGGNWTNSADLVVGRIGNGTLAISGNGSVSNSNGYIGRNAGSTGILTVSGGIWTSSGDIAVGLTGNGTLSISGNSSVSANTVTVAYSQNGTGTLNLNGGTLSTGQVAKGLGSNGTVSFNGGTLQLTGNQASLFNGFGSNDVKLNGSGGTINTQGFAVASAQALSGSGSLTKQGSGTLTLTGTNTYTGATTVSAGALYVNGDNKLATGDVTVQSGGTLGGGGNIGGNVTVQSGGTITAGRNATSTDLLSVNNLSLLSGGTALLKIQGLSAFDSIWAKDVLSATGNVTLSLQLSGGYTGEVGDAFKIFNFTTPSFDITNFALASNLGSQFQWDLTGLTSNGTVAIISGIPAPTHWLGQTDSTWSGTNWASDGNGTATTATPTRTDNITFSATGATHQTPVTLDVDATIKSLTVDDTVGLTGNKTLTVTGGTTIGNGNLTLSNGITLRSNSNIASMIAENSGADASVTVNGGNWTNVSNLIVGSSGNGTLNVTDNGTVSVGANGTGTVNLGVSSGSVGTLNIGSYGGNSTAGTLNAAEVDGGSGTATVNFNQTDAITFAPKITGGASANQLGGGTTTLIGNSTYTGATSVSAGALYVNGDNSAATGDVTVSGGTLAGSGNIGGNVTVQSGGTITAGADETSGGHLTTNNLTLLDGSTALFKLSNPNNLVPVILQGGILTSSGNLTLSLQLIDGYAGTLGDTFKLFAYDRNFGTTNFLISTNLSNGLAWDTSFLTSQGIVLIKTDALAATHWLGQTDSNWSGANWASNAAGNATTATPTSADDITFSANGATNQTNTVLDVDTSIKSLTVNSTAGIQGNNTLTITGDTNVNAGTLTLSGGVTMLTGGKSVIDGTGDGAAVNVDGTGSTWTTTGDLIVGNNAIGALNVNGGAVSSNNLYVGNYGGSNGTVTLTDGTINANFLTIGEAGGTGNLFISGGVLTNPDAYITDYAGSGRATVSGGTWNNTGNLYVGGGGLGTLDITGGLVTTGVSARLGLVGGTEGRVTVSGNGTFQNAGVLIVGDVGTGTLNIQNGGTVSVGANGTGNLTLASEAGSTGTLNIGAFGGNSTAGTLNTAEVTGGNGTATVNFNQSDATTFTPKITGSISLNQLGNGSTALTGDSNYTGETKVSAGALYVNGDNSAATGDVTVSGGTLSGNDRIGGNVTVQIGGKIAAGSDAATIGTLTLGNNLSLLDGSTAAFRFGSQNLFDSISVGGNISLTGSVILSLQVLSSYTPVLNDSFKIFSLANPFDASGFTLDTNLTGFKWNLTRLGTDGIVSLDPPAPPTAYWNGTTNSNWNYSSNATTNWVDAQTGGADTKTIPGQNSDVIFTADNAQNLNTTLGEDLKIQSLTVNTTSAITIGGANTLTILGPKALTVADDAGLVTISTGDLILPGTTTQFDIGNSATALIATTISGASALEKSGVGTLILTGSNTYTGGTTISGGILQLGDGGTTGSVLGNIVDSDTLVFKRSDNLTFSDKISGTGSLIQNGSGTLNITGSNTYTGGTTVRSGMLQLSGTGSITHPDAILVVGSVFGDNANLLISDPGSSLTAGNIYLGRGAGSTGNATVTNGKLTSSADALIVGAAGTGVLQVNGGFVSSNAGIIGNIAGSNGTATVTNGTWANSGTLTVGASGSGQLMISGGLVSNTQGFIGDSTGSQGAATVSGGTWGSSSDLFIGKAGTGTLLVNGGNVSNINANIGSEAGSSGNATVSSGAWLNSGELTVGASGNGTLNITGGTVSNTTGNIGGAAGSQAAATVSGGTWNNTASLVVGGGGLGTLDITGGLVTTGVSTRLGLGGGTEGRVTVSGNGTFQNAGVLIVGDAGTGTLDIKAGGTVTSLNGIVAAQVDSNGTVTVNGSGSTWTMTGDLSVDTGGTGELNITAGGEVSDVNGFIATGSIPALKGTVTVDGSGSTWTNTGNLTVGDTGPGNLNIKAGGLVTSLNGIVAAQVGSNGTVTVNGSGSKWTMTGDLYVGKDNGGVNLTVSDGGALTNGKTVIGYDAASDSNTVLITGAETAWNSSVTFHLGYNGSENQMTVSDGAAVSVSAQGGQNVDSLIGFNDGSNYNNLTVTGEGSSFTNNATLYVGRSGIGNRLDILEGGLVTSKNVRIGGGTGSNGITEDSFALVDGAGSTWDISGTMRVGSSGSFSGLTISSGGAVTVTGNSFVGYDATSNGNSVLVWDAGSRWSVNALTIGRLGTNNVVTVALDGNLTASSITVGEQAGSSGTLQLAQHGVVSIDGGEGTLHLAQSSNSTGTLNIGVGNNKMARNISKYTTGGTLDASEVNGGTGTATINFYQTDNPYLFLPKITGSTSVNQNGPGTTVIQTANTYTGGTTVRNGVLQTINPSALGTGPVTINSGILGVAGPLSEISSLAWAGGNIALSPGQGDMVTTTGKFINSDAGGEFLIGTTGLKQQTYTLVNFESTNFLLGDFSALFTSPGTKFDYSFALNEGNVQITILGATDTGNQLHNIENGVPTFGDFTATGNVVSGLAPDGVQESNTIVAALGTTPGSALDVPDWNTLNITGNQPTIIVDGSNLNLDGTLNAKQIIIDALAQMTGHGLLNGDLLNQGTVAPGNSPGTLTISGNFTQTSTGTLQIQIASPTVFDQLVVSGTASLAGTLQVESYGGYQLQYGEQFTFLHAGSITGQFDSITTSDPSIYRARFLVDGGAGTILIAPTSYTLVAVTQNQKNVAKALDGFIKATSGDRQAVSIALDLQASAQYPAAFDAIAPTFYESLTDITIEQTNARAQMLAQRASAVRLGSRGFQAIGIEAPLKYDKDGRGVMDAKDGKNILSPADDNNWGVWVQGNGIFAHAAGIGGVSSYNFQNGGVLVGGDYRWSEHFVTGVYGGYQGTYSKYGNGGVTTINAVDFGLYAGYQNGGFYTDAILGGGSSSYAVRRPIQFSTVDRTAISRPDGGQFTSYLGLGYDWQAGNFTFGPVLTGQYTYAGIAPFTENGAGALDLAVGQQNASSLRTSIGGRIAYTWKLSENIALIPEGRLFWQHEFMENPRNISSSLDGGGGPSFDYTTSAPDRDAVFAGAGISAQFGPNWNAYVYYNADFGRQDYISHSISTGLNFKF